MVDVAMADLSLAEPAGEEVGSEELDARPPRTPSLLLIYNTRAASEEPKRGVTHIGQGRGEAERERETTTTDEPTRAREGETPGCSDSQRK